MRVIAGQWGGRRLQAPSGESTRPTSDRVREALFSILAPRIEGARVLDLFAGSGALGIEALSRGAAAATFVDSAAAAIRAVRANLEALGIEAEVVRADARRFLGGASAAARQYDLVFLDPPYRLAATPRTRPDGGAAGGAGAGRGSGRRERSPGAARARPPLEDERRYGDTLIRIHGPR